MTQTHLRRALWHAMALLMLTAVPAWPCTIAWGPLSPSDMVRGADVIVRAIAVDYSTPPATDQVFPFIKSVVRFKVVEILKGSRVPAEVLLPGELTARDDFNEEKPPYTFVRPGGASFCHAFSYRRGAEFLLILKDVGTSFTLNWNPKGAVNEQLRSQDDPWLAWVRQELKK